MVARLVACKFTQADANTLPGRLELPTLRLTASRSNQLSYGSRYTAGCCAMYGAKGKHCPLQLDLANTFAWSQAVSQNIGEKVISRG
jgi:hypothetical protein